MKTKIIFITTNLIMLFCVSYAQNRHVVLSGTIEFEKTVNMFAVLQRMAVKHPDNPSRLVYESYKAEQPQFKTFKSLLYFSENELMFVPQEDTEDMMRYRNPMITQNNLIYTDGKAGKTTILKSINEKRFLIKDSIAHIDWKITDERREILGFSCRRANALVMDSVYVVAFYTDKIPVSGGPESFTGLPGMILGVVLPRENINWFATRLTEQPVEPGKLRPKMEGLPITKKQFSEQLKTIVYSWKDADNGIIRAIIF
jgi:GLPGLI family protein